MKKLIVSLILIIGFTSVYAQKSNVSKAKNKALMENPDFSGARDLIKPALTDESTKDQANTWYVAGLIGYKENENFDKQAILGKTADPDQKGEVVIESYKYLVVADSLDQLPDEKGKVKPKHRKDIKKMIGEYYTYNLVSYGAHLFDRREYKKAYDVFDIFLDIPNLPLMENSVAKDTTYTMIKYYAAISATNADMPNEAIALYEDLKDENYESLGVYQLLYEEYVKQKDTVNYVKVLQEGVEKFPQEAWFLQNLINYYIYSGQTQEALDYLNTAISRDPNLAQYRFVEGGLKESLGDIEGSFEAYKKAIELDPNMASAYAEVGRLHYNRAIAIGDASDTLTDAKKRKAEEVKATEEFKAALPFYQKANQMQPDEMSYKVMLRTLYYRLKMYTEYEVIDKEIKAITGE